MTHHTTRQYGASIALVSGLYALLSTTGGTGMMGSNSGLLMVLLGIVAVVHGVVLLTPAADRLGSASGPLMIGYALVMLLNQVLVRVRCHIPGVGKPLGLPIGQRHPPRIRLSFPFAQKRNLIPFRSTPNVRLVGPCIRQAPATAIGALEPEVGLVVSITYHKHCFCAF